MTPELMTVKKAAEVLSTSVDKINRERRAGRLESVYLDSVPRVRTADLIAWAKSAPTEPPGLNA